jgi:hypothetical protein
MAKKAVPIVLMIFGGALFLGVILFALDRATSPEPEGLGTWIFAILGFLLSAASGIKGWLEWNKKDTPPQVTSNTAFDGGQVATGEGGGIFKQRNTASRISRIIMKQNPIPLLFIRFTNCPNRPRTSPAVRS